MIFILTLIISETAHPEKQTIAHINTNYTTSTSKPVVSDVVEVETDSCAPNAPCSAQLVFVQDLNSDSQTSISTVGVKIWIQIHKHLQLVFVQDLNSDSQTSTWPFLDLQLFFNVHNIHLAIMSAVTEAIS